MSLDSRPTNREKKLKQLGEPGKIDFIPEDPDKLPDQLPGKDKPYKRPSQEEIHNNVMKADFIPEVKNDKHGIELTGSGKLFKEKVKNRRNRNRGDSEEGDK